MDGEHFHTIEQAAEVLGLTTDQTRQLLRDGEPTDAPPKQSGPDAEEAPRSPPPTQAFGWRHSAALDGGWHPVGNECRI